MMKTIGEKLHIVEKTIQSSIRRINNYGVPIEYKNNKNEEKFLKWYEDNYFSKENKYLMDKTINEYREYQVLTSWQNSSWSDLEEYDDVIED